MSRRKHSDGEEEKDLPQEAPKSEPEPSSPPPVPLRLTQNAYVGQYLQKAGTIFSFTSEEAEKRLKRQKFWERI